MKLMSWESAENDLVQSELCADDRTLARHHHHADVNRKRVALFFFLFGWIGGLNRLRLSGFRHRRK